MSATGRGHARHTLDFYETPPESSDSALEALEALDLGVGGRTVLDPGCGTGAIGVRALAYGAHRVVGIEMDLSRGARAHARGIMVLQEDFLAMRPELEHDIAGLDPIGLFNPPYRTKQYREAAAMFIRTSQRLCTVSTVLLRQGFFGSCRSRRDLIEGIGLRAIVNLPKRPSFCVAATCKGCGGSWQFPARTPKAECLHPDTGIDRLHRKVHHEDRPCDWRGRPPSGAKGALYRASDTDAADYAWGIWKRGYAGPVETRWAW